MTRVIKPKKKFSDRLVDTRSMAGKTPVERWSGGMSSLQNRNLVFVVDDDAGTLRGLKRLLRAHGYDSVLFPSAEAFRNHGQFEAACCVVLDVNLNKES